MPQGNQNSLYNGLDRSGARAAHSAPPNKTRMNFRRPEEAALNTKTFPFKHESQDSNRYTVPGHLPNFRELSQTKTNECGHQANLPIHAVPPGRFF